MTRLKANIRNALLTSAALGLSATAAAQTPPPAQTPPAQAATASDPAALQVTDAMLQTFAPAWVDVKKISDEYQPRINAATGEEQEALKKEQNERMTAALQAHGMDVKTFNDINQAAAKDPALKERVGEAITKAQGAAAPATEGAAKPKG